MKKNKTGKCTGKAIAIIAFSMLMSLTVLTGCNTDDNSSTTSKPKHTTLQTQQKDDSDKDASQKDSLKKDASQTEAVKNNNSKNDNANNGALNNDSLNKNDSTDNGIVKDKAAQTEAQTSSAAKDAVPAQTTASGNAKNN